MDHHAIPLTNAAHDAAGRPRPPTKTQPALLALSAQLQALPEDMLVEPKVQVALVLDEARELLGLLRRSGIRERIKSVGVPEGELDELGPVIDAVEEAEKLWAAKRDENKSLRQVQAEALAYSLRDEMVAACRFNLSGLESVEVLARVTDGENARDLVQDLRELATFVSENVSAFVGDSSFEPLLCSEEARELAAAIAVDGEPTAEALEYQELRDRALTLLCGRVQQLREAGRYAFRGTVEARAFFSSNLCPTRRRHPLPSLVQVLTG